MKRREFFRCMIGGAASLALSMTLPEAKLEVMGVDVGAEGSDSTFVGLHATNAAAPDNLGGFLIPQEYADKLIGAINAENKKKQCFIGASQTVRYNPSIVHLPADRNLLIDNSKQVYQDFAEFLKGGAA